MPSEHTITKADVEQHAEYIAENTPLTDKQALAFSFRQCRGVNIEEMPFDRPELMEINTEIAQLLNEATKLLELAPHTNSRWHQQPLELLSRTYFGTDDGGNGDDMEYLALHEHPFIHKSPSHSYSHRYYLTHKIGEWRSPSHDLTVHRQKYNDPEAIVKDVLNSRDDLDSHAEVKLYAFLKNAGFSEYLPDAVTLAEDWHEYAIYTAVSERVLRASEAANLLETTNQTVLKYATNKETEPHKNFLSYTEF